MLFNNESVSINLKFNWFILKFLKKFVLLKSTFLRKLNKELLIILKFWFLKTSNCILSIKIFFSKSWLFVNPSIKSNKLNFIFILLLLRIVSFSSLIICKLEILILKRFCKSLISNPISSIMIWFSSILILFAKKDWNFFLFSEK